MAWWSLIGIARLNSFATFTTLKHNLVRYVQKKMVVIACTAGVSNRVPHHEACVSQNPLRSESVSPPAFPPIEYVSEHFVIVEENFLSFPRMVQRQWEARMRVFEAYE